MATANFTTKPPMLDEKSRKTHFIMSCNLFGIPSRCRSQARGRQIAEKSNREEQRNKCAASTPKPTNVQTSH
jgi:hypothetical protein